MNTEQLHEELSAKTVAQIRAFASDQGISLPSKARKADLIALVIDLLSSKSAPEPQPAKPVETEAQMMRFNKTDLYAVAEAEGVRTTADMTKGEIVAAILSNREAEEQEAQREKEREANASTVITLSCGHPFEVSHLNVFPKDVKAYLRKAEKEAECPRCPSAVAEPEGEVSTTPEPTEEVSAPTPTKAKKSSATPKVKAPRPVKKAARKDGREKSVEKHAPASRRLLKAKTGEEKADIVEELITDLGTVWTAAATPTATGAKVIAKCGFSRIEIKYTDAALDSIWYFKTSQDKGRKLRNVSAVLQQVAKADKALPATTDQGPQGGAEPKAARELTPVAA